ncbi:septum formation initiator family protein [uncultured Clostridium sp.]|jgi:cell division protein FtsB|uniref:FtsB family cell division protein n=1 Tax=uncultured Clostridium sp. TaxID=59620 RepID=UPI002624DEE9|nr:septum formation initiator family protein [uncultured Clostridium sp.]
MKMRVNAKALALLGVGVLFTTTFINQEITKKKLNDNKVKVEQELKNLKQKNIELTEEFNDSKTDSYIERMARERLGMIKEGEQVVVD